MVKNVLKQLCVFMPYVSDYRHDYQDTPTLNVIIFLSRLKIAERFPT